MSYTSGGFGSSRQTSPPTASGQAGGRGRLSENCVLNIKNKSHSVTAGIEVPETGAEGVIIAQSANIGGWSLYAKNGKLKYCYNLAGVHRFYVEAARALPAGEHRVRMEFAYTGGGLGKVGEVTRYVDGENVGEGAIPMTQAMVFSADDGCDVGEDSGAPMSQDYGSRGNAFNGTVKGVQLAIGDAVRARITSSRRRRPSASRSRGSNRKRRRA
jgi:arylsulfatase